MTAAVGLLELILISGYCLLRTACSSMKMFLTLTICGGVCR